MGYGGDVEEAAVVLGRTGETFVFKRLDKDYFSSSE